MARAINGLILPRVARSLSKTKTKRSMSPAAARRLARAFATVKKTIVFASYDLDKSNKNSGLAMDYWIITQDGVKHIAQADRKSLVRIK
jgi:hypothetical protein